MKRINALLQNLQPADKPMQEAIKVAAMASPMSVIASAGQAVARQTMAP